MNIQEKRRSLKEEIEKTVVNFLDVLRGKIVLVYSVVSGCYLKKDTKIRIKRYDK